MSRASFPFILKKTDERKHVYVTLLVLWSNTNLCLDDVYWDILLGTKLLDYCVIVLEFCRTYQIRLQMNAAGSESEVHTLCNKDGY